MTLLEAIRDRQLFAPFFRNPDTWASWLVVLKAIFGLGVSDSEQDLFRRCTGRTKAFVAGVTEGWLICGRRSGKSFVAALIATFLAAFRDYSRYLAPGEIGVVLVLAVDKAQAGVIFSYVCAFFDGIPLLAKLVVGRTAESLDLSNGVSIEVHSSNFRGVRGRTIVAALCDEISFWRSDDSSNPDKEVLNAVRPGMVTIPGALLLCLSSPYARRGALFEAFERHHGNDGSDVLVWRADTRTMNPTIDELAVKRAYDQDPLSAASEYGADFRSDVSTFLEEQWVTDSVDPGCHERPAAARFQYVCFVDPSGGKRDSFTAAVSHRQGDTLFLDMAREWRAPLDPATVVGEIAALVKPYNIRSVTGDAYGGEWPRTAFRAAGLSYEVSERSRSEIYLETGPLLAQARIRLIDFQRLTMQLRQLERRTSVSGRDAVNHPPGGADDLSNSALGSLWLASKKPSREFSVQRPRQKFAIV